MKTFNWLAAMAVAAALAGGAVSAYAQNMQQTIDTTRFESRAAGDVALTHRWSGIAMVPAGDARNITALCDNGVYPTGGGYLTASSDLQVTSSHAFAYRNGTAGWFVSVVNNNATTPLAASVDVLCLSELAVTTPTTETPPVQEQPEPSSDEELTVETDSESYSAGDTITITGTVADREPDASVLVNIINPDSEKIVFTAVPVTASNTYRLSFDASDNGLEEILGNLGSGGMEDSGTYLVSVSYCATDCAIAETTFEFEG